MKKATVKYTLIRACI